MHINETTKDLRPYDPLFHIVTEDFYLANPPEVKVVDNPSGGPPLFLYRGPGWSAMFEFDDNMGAGGPSIMDIVSGVRPAQTDA